MKNFILILMGVLLQTAALAQSEPSLVHRGTIQFERKVNMYDYLDDMSKSGNRGWLERAREKIDKYKVDKFEMDFTKDESIYKPAEDGIMELKMPWISIQAEKNIVYENFQNKTFTSQKEIYDKTILLKDTLPQYTWKIKEEFRNIAGYNCRRAETVIMDSVWVIAFYTDAIIAPGGPESFNGLPGMILGLVMPRLNVTYFATGVQPYTDARRTIEPPQKGKENTLESFTKYLQSNMKNWGEFLERILWYSSI